MTRHGKSFISKHFQRQYCCYWKSSLTLFFYCRSKVIQLLKRKNLSKGERQGLWACLSFLDSLLWRGYLKFSIIFLIMSLYVIPMHIHPAIRFGVFISFWYPSHTTQLQNNASSSSFDNGKRLAAVQIAIIASITSCLYNLYISNNPNWFSFLELHQPCATSLQKKVSLNRW